jgi:predicted transposase YdaD
MKSPEQRAEAYFDIMQASISRAVRRELRAMDPEKYHEYQSAFAKRYFARGREEGKAEGRVVGRAELIVRLLTRRFGRPRRAQLVRLATASIEELDAIGERLLSAKSLQEALGEP